MGLPSTKIQPIELSKGLKKKSSTEPWTPDEKASLASIIGKVFDLQKQYGKTNEQLDNVVAGFLWAMQDYPLEKVVEGFKTYIRQKSDMPTPSDIVAIIDPQTPKWEPDKQYYGRLKKLREEGGPYALNQEEADYMQAYDDYMKANYIRSTKDV